jgi:uncharacterized repeat protein (TIGR03809 family)
MPADRAARRFAEIAHKWRALVDRRCSHLVELQRTGDWRYHYEEEEFLELIREALAWTQTWRKLAPGPQDAEVVGAGSEAPVRRALP